MYKWQITYHLVGGQTIQGVYEGPENDSNSVIERLLRGDENTFNGIAGEYGVSNLIVRNRDISAMDVRIWRG